MGGGPHMRMRLSSPAAGMCSASISSLMKPEEYFQSSPGLSRVYQILRRSGCAAARDSRVSRTRMSASVWLAKRSDIVVLSSASLRMAVMICSIGVMPVPPAIMPSLLAVRGLRLMRKLPLPVYSMRPNGPWMVISSPTLRLSMYWESFPPSGKRSMTPPLYTLMTRSKCPLSSSLLVGVYFLEISTLPASGSGLPFHSPSTTPTTFGAKTVKCLPTGRPSVVVAVGREKR
mmetsp:Transcript_14109/g.55567  ORF Transcript_14109/g.55567 Transcript_14109/m.55567 type:complete len:231 (+) Transcript_14109:96-788(+)